MAQQNERIIVWIGISLKCRHYDTFTNKPTIECNKSSQLSYTALVVYAYLPKGILDCSNFTSSARFDFKLSKELNVLVLIT